jgi:tight adherence protein C
MLLLPGLVFISVTLAIAGLFLWLIPSRTDRRIQALTATPTSKGEWSETIVKIAGPLAQLTVPKGDWDTSPLRIKFLNAGIRNDDARLFYFAAKTVLPVFFALLAFATLRGWSQVEGLTLFFYILVAALIGIYIPNFILRRKIKRRQREIFESFPDAADLMLVCVEAGLGLDAGLSRVADEVKMKSLPLAEELHLTNLEMRAGGTREKSLHNLAFRTGIEEIGTFAVMLTQADKFGTSIGDSLRVFSDDLRHKRQVRAEEQAAKVPGKMLFPLVTCIFPSIIMVMLGPAVIQIIRTLLPLLTGSK